MVTNDKQFMHLFHKFNQCLVSELYSLIKSSPSPFLDSLYVTIFPSYIFLTFHMQKSRKYIKLLILYLIFSKLFYCILLIIFYISDKFFGWLYVLYIYTEIYVFLLNLWVDYGIKTNTVLGKNQGFPNHA